MLGVIGPTCISVVLCSCNVITLKVGPRLPGKTKTLCIAKESGGRQAKYVRNQGVANSAGGAQDEVPAMRDRYCHFCESLLSWNMQDGDSLQDRRPNNICVKLI